MTDPLAPLLDLPDVAEKADKVAKEIAAIHRHRANLRGWDVTGAESTLRGARASAKLAGGDTTIPDSGDVDDPILAGAIRCAGVLAPEKITETVTTFRRAPLQIIAKLNTLAAPQPYISEPGRPDPAADGRLHLLGNLLTGSSQAGSAIISAVAHGELLSLSPFASANGVTARALSRLVTVAGGLDPRGLSVPEVYWSKNTATYESAAAGFASGDVEGVRQWILFHLEGLSRGSREAWSIAEAKVS